MVGFLVSLAINLAIQIGLNRLSRLLEPARKRPKPSPFESPTASSGGPLGKGFGVYEAQPTVVLVEEPQLEQDHHGDLPVTRYYVKLILVLGWGRVNVLYDIISDERAISTQQPGELQSLNGGDPDVILPALPFDFDAALADAVEFSINARQMYGGGGEQGGLQGLLMFYNGSQDQPIDPLTAEIDQEFASSYPWTVYVRLGAETGRAEGVAADGLNQQGDRFYVSTNSPAPKPIHFLLGAYPDALLGDGGRIGVGANGAEVLYQIYTDTKWGMRKPASRFDTQQWAEKAALLKAENIPLAIPQDTPGTADDLVEDILRHIDGGIVEDPTTGLLQLKLARDDYDIDDLLVIGAHNTEGLKRGKPLAPKSVNDIQIKYRRFHGGKVGETPPGGELVTDDWEPNFVFASGGRHRALIYSTNTTTIEPDSVHAFVDDVEVPVRAVDTIGEWQDGDQVLFDPDEGWFAFVEGTNVVEGAEIRIEYVSNPSYMAFVDDVATAQNLASQQARQHQPESYDFPFYITPFGAQWKADRMRATLSRAIDTFTWEGKRDQSHLTEWDVVKLLEPKWGITEPITIRITKVSRGTRTDPKLTFEGVKDIWGEQIFLSTVGSTNPPPQVKVSAPAMAIACGVSGDEDIARIDLFPSSATYGVEVYEAYDEAGTNAVLVQTIAAGTTPMFYEGAEGKYYAARQISSFTRPGPLTAWITCVGSVDPPVDPTCVLPTWEIDADDLLGTVTIVFTDPQHRVQLVEFRHRTGGGAWTAWTTASEPYCDAVTPSATECSRVEWRITYLACDGTAFVVTDGHDFCPVIPDPDPPPGPQPTVTQEIEVVLHAGGTWPIGVDETEIPAEGERLPLTVNKSTEVKTPVTWATSAHITASFSKSDLPTSLDLRSSYLVIRGRVPAGTEGAIWQSLGENDTPRLPLDNDTLLAMDDEATIVGSFPVCVEGEPVDIRDEFLGARLHIAADIVGADGTVLVESIITRLSVWLKKGVTDTPIPPSEPPETEEPPPYDPGSCDTPDSLSMSAGSENDQGGSATTWVRGTNTASLTISGSATGFSRVEQTLTGLLPDAKHTLYLSVDTNGHEEVDAFLEAVGQADAVSGSGSLVELEVTAYSDSAGEIDVRWGVRNLAGAGGGGSFSIDTEDFQSVGDITGAGFAEITTGGTPPNLVFDGAVKDSGATSLRFDVDHPAWTGGSRYFERYFPGFPPGAACTGTIRMRHDGMPWYANAIFKIGVTATGQLGEPDADTWGTLESIGGEIDDDGRLYVQFGARSASSAVEDFKVWFDGVIEVEVAGVGSIVIDFSDLGICEGSGKGTDGTGVGGDPDNPGNEPIPDPPPGGWPEPPVPLTRWFMIWNISAVGLGPWNATALRFTPKTAANILRACEENDTFVFMSCGPESEQLLNGAFHEPYWRAQMQALYDDPESRAAIQAASTGTGPFTKVRVVHKVFDEPFHPVRWGSSNGVGYAATERGCIMSKQLFPNLETMIRVDPTDVRYVRKMTGLDSMWGEYSLARGPIDSYIATRTAAAAEWGHFLYLGLHYKHFEGPAGPSPRYITPTELRHYGRDRIAALPTSKLRGMGGWKYETGLWSQSGLSTAAFETRDKLAVSA